MTRTLLRREPTPASTLTTTVHPFDRLVQGLFRDPLLTGGMSLLSSATDVGVLEVDIAETDDAVLVHASVPGFGREDIAIDIHDGVLSITATTSDETEQTEPAGDAGQIRYHRRERRTGSVSRRIALPVAVNEEGAEAMLNNGVLELRLPKDSAAGPRRIAIN